jgi:GT2 family glycosyltransferase
VSGQEGRLPAKFKDYVRNAHVATQLVLARATFLAKGTHISPSVSILIPVHNRLDLTRPCLESVFANTDPSVPFELLLIDDVSADGTAEYLRSLGSRIRVIANRRRGCFGHNINRAAPQTRGEYLCLLNNDTLVTPGWLTRLLAAARNDPTIGVVGNRHLTPGTDLINHAGMVFDNERYPIHLHVGRPASFPPALVSREFQCVTGACWLVPKTLFLELGGFDPEFRNSYEDVDFCLRVRAHGRKVFYAADSMIYHYRAQSPGRLDNEASNLLHFRSKWEAQIVSDLDDYLVRDNVQPEPTETQAQPHARSIAEGDV